MDQGENYDALSELHPLDVRGNLFACFGSIGLT